MSYNFIIACFVPKVYSPSHITEFRPIFYQTFLYNFTDVYKSLCTNTIKMFRRYFKFLLE